ncbi:thiamine biosynthesis protein ThiF [Gottschalkia purinilytica]|uniref:Thiamine biosynthesis protein ThiF n=1 Tax=Gottschalkia purinilytica TaxID=1503 RepID=A0A0L0WEY2_GOTPU|nr:sulfur carrier protein ThiS adenylyltransferase ThiF [Gottschalkia purinilytica]KNF10042.1 thiamine biosynthesis protein ThiF [Gottschalkia purinilytica]
MNELEKTLITQLGKKNFNKIQSVTIGIAGAGGLGSNCDFNLVRSGFKNFVIVDFDIVESSNLNRQFYFYHQLGMLKVHALKENLYLINPDINLTVLDTILTSDNIEKIFSNCNIIVEAFDKASCKKMISEKFMNSNKLLASASGLAGWGKSDDIKTHVIKDNFFIVGDLVSEVSDITPPISPRVNIVAAKQANIVLDYIIKNF